MKRYKDKPYKLLHPHLCRRYVLLLFSILMTIGFTRVWSQTEISSLDDITNAQGNYTLSSTFSTTGTPADNIGTNSNPFKGIIDGQLVPITGTWDKPLFDYVEDATIKNVIIETASVSGSARVGAIAGMARGASRIYNCGILSGSVGSTGTSTEKNNSDCCGGLVGSLDGTSRVINCFSYATITGGNRVGGIVGYNNNLTTSSSTTTMIMNCMFYGDITGGYVVSPIYGGNSINNLNSGGLDTFNYYAYDELKTKSINYYNCALAVEDRFLTRFEFYRQLLNSNKKLAAIYITNNASDANLLAKWVLETADRSIVNPKPYPVLKAQGYYPSIINMDVENAPDSVTVGRNKGGKLGRTLSVTILTKSQKTDGGQSWPTAVGSDVQTTSLTLTRTDMDKDRFNFNHDKVQLPYYNDIGTGNYTEGRVVTGWKITAVSGGTAGTYTAADQWNGYNFADRKCTDKDLYSVSGRVFSQGAYYDVPYGVTAITIEPYWGNAAYLADQYYDVVFNTKYERQNVTQLGTQVSSSTTFGGKTVKTSVNDALGTISSAGSTVYDNAIVLVGNFHQDVIYNKEPFKSSNTPFTIMSVDLDNDNEPDYSLIFHDNNRSRVNPIRFDFLNIPGTAQAQKPKEISTILNASVFSASAWFEITNTCLIYFSQFEYENSNKTAGNSPIILLGGVYDQFTSTKVNKVDYTTYLHVGGNAWFKDFGNGTHSDGNKATKHIPISVTGGEYEGFYLSGTYNSNASTNNNDNAECYISSGHFKELAGAGLEQIRGNVQWQIYDADIDNFFGGGINDAKPISGTITTDINNSHVGTFCGGPKFGNMASGKTVTTTAKGCTFNKFFGAGYGGNSVSRKKYFDSNKNINWGTTLQGYYIADRGFYYDGGTTGLGPDAQHSTQYGYKGLGVATDFDYEFFVWTSGSTGGRFFVKFATFSLAQCNNVESNLTDCTINDNFYGGGNLGQVTGTATSVLNGCTVYGNVFGGGFSAELPKIPVRTAGFKKNPNFNNNSGMFEPGEFSDTVHYEWKNATEAGITLSNGSLGIDDTNHYIYTNQELTTLGQVGNTDLTVRGNTYVQGVIVNGKDIGGVFGGGDESLVNGSTKVNIETSGERIIKNVYGGGNVANVGGSVEVNIKSGTVSQDVYGGGALANTNINNTTSTATNTTTVNLTGGTINRDVYGGGLGDAGHAALVKGNVLVELNNGVDNAVKGCVVAGRIFGCNNLNGTPEGTVTVHVYKTQNANAESITGMDAKVLGNYDVYAVYGGGNLAAASTSFAPEVIIEGCGETSIRSVYGGGNAAAVPATNVTVNSCFEIGYLFGGGNGSESPANVTNDTRAALYGGTIHNVFGGSNTAGNIGGTINVIVNESSSSCRVSIDECYGGGNLAASNAGSISIGCAYHIGRLFGGARNANITGDINLQITSGHIDNVFGGNNLGGLLDGDVSIIINDSGAGCGMEVGNVYGGGNKADVKGSVAVAIINGIVTGDVYGGGALANTNVGNATNYGESNETITSTASNTTTVSLTGGSITGNVYGGALGQRPGYNGAASSDPEVSAFVYGNVLVELDGSVVKGDVFGCNNVNGTPKGTVTVHVYKTQGYEGHDLSSAKNDNAIEKTGAVYELNAVYGGGNMAAYEPNDLTNGKTDVIIDGCALTSIQYVYGGGNAASVPATNVTINGCYELGYVFGGGNGRDDIIVNGQPQDNPGADIGYKDSGTTSYGSGESLVVLHGGVIHNAFGGSNTKGNVRTSSTVRLDEKESSASDYCQLVIEEVYGAGNEAEQDGKAEIDLGCTPGMAEIYGGSRMAHINNNIILNITSGTFGRVFGGNNLGGEINGTITVNIEETGCHPVIIGQLYGGGNEAAYTAPWKDDYDHSKGRKDGPTLNIKSFTSIGEVFGGGYGQTATVTGDTYVNINEVTGVYYNADASVVTQGTTVYGLGVPAHAKGSTMGSIGTVFGGGNAARVLGNTNVNIGTEATIDYVSVARTAIPVLGASITGNVYGGGNQADVTGNTNVTIGEEN